VGVGTVEFLIWPSRRIVKYMDMTIRLKPDMEALIQKYVQRGPYQSADEFVQRAVQMLHEQEQ
jgi:Arc/MetJ-type ribon-helix-helix transcriptional regulator